MKKLSLLMFAFGASAFIAGSTNFNKTPKKDLNTDYIVVLDTKLQEGEEAVKASQSVFKKNLRYTLGFDFEIKKNFTHALNGVVVKANANDKSKIEQIPNVTRVTKNETYFFGDISEGVNGGKVINETAVIKDEIPVNPTINYSLETMNVPAESKGGEGVLVAVLDSGFLLNHNAFAGLDEGVTQRYTKESMKKVFTDHPNDMNAKWIEGITVDENPDGTLADGDHNTYYNSKIPFQYDYGGVLYTDIKDGASTYWTPDETQPDGYREISQTEMDAGFAIRDGNAYSPFSDHGTHVAGTIAGHDKNTYAEGDYDGVAPNAQLALMKVFTDYIPKNGIQTGEDVEYPQMPGTGASDEQILAALEDCVILDVDVVNMSLGQDLNDFDNKSESFKAFENLRENGTLVNVSAGNNGRQLMQLMGPYGSHLLNSVETGTMGSYSNSEDVLTIGSGNLTVQHFEKAIMIGDNAIAYDDQASKEKDKTLNEDLPLSKLPEIYGKTDFEYYFVNGWGEKDDYPKTMPNPNPEDALINPEVPFTLTGKIAVVDRGGGVTFTAKIAAAKANDAAAIIIVDNDPGATDFHMRMDLKTMDGSIGIPVVMVLNKDRLNLKDAAEKKLSIIANRDVNNPNVGKMSEFSTDGATYDLRIKPEIVAPGSVIKGPVPGKTDYSNDMMFAQDKTKYDWMSGTSMSAPNYSGSSALLLGEVSADRETRREYAKTLPARTMSTADLQTWERKGEKFNNEYNEATFFSPRRQGAGFVNVTEARDSKLYLEGAVKNKAKIELFNTKDISEGKISLDFTVYNETGKQVTYKPTVYVMRPDTTVYSEKLQPARPGEPAPEYEFPDWIGRELQSINDKLIYKHEFKDDLTIGKEASTKVKLDTFQVPQTELDAINEKFPNGTYLEGYVVLEPTTSSAQIEGVKTLNIPYMGFYGDYFAEEPVEKFDFEREEGEFLGSDLIHTLAKRVSLETADYGSYIRGIPSSSLSSDRYYDNLQSMWTNKQSVKSFTKELTYDPDTNSLHAGGKNQTDLLLIQMFVNRSIASSKVELLKQGDPTHKNYAFDVFGDERPRFYSPLYGATSDSIAKSMATAGFLTSVLAHRAYAYVPLDGLEEGTYELKMSFEIQAARGLSTDRINTNNPNGIYSKSVNIIVDNSPAEIHHSEVIDVEGTSYLRVYVSEKYLRDVTFNGGFVINSIFKYDEEKGLYYSQAKLQEILDFSEEGKLYITLEDESYNLSKYVTNIDATGKVTYWLNCTWMKSGYKHDLSIKETVEDGVTSYVYRINMIDNNEDDVKISNSNQLTVTIDVSNYDMSDFDLWRIDEDTGIRIRIKNYDYDEEAQTLTFKVRGNSFALDAKRTSELPDPDKPNIPDTDTPEVPETPDKPNTPTPNNGGNNLGLILGLSIPLSIVALGAIAFGIVLLIKKRK